MAAVWGVVWSSPVLAGRPPSLISRPGERHPLAVITSIRGVRKVQLFRTVKYSTHLHRPCVVATWIHEKGPGRPSCHGRCSTYHVPGAVRSTTWQANGRRAGLANGRPYSSISHFFFFWRPRTRIRPAAAAWLLPAWDPLSHIPYMCRTHIHTYVPAQRHTQLRRASVVKILG